MDIGAVAVKSPVFNPVDNGVYIALDLFTGNVGPGFRIQKRTGRITEKECAPLRKTSLLFIRLRMKLPGKDIKSHHIPRNFSFLGNGDHQFPGDNILIGVCKNDFAVGLRSLCIPGSILHIIIPVSLPGIRGNDFSVDDRIGIYLVFAHDIRKAPHKNLNPGFRIAAAFQLLVDVPGTQAQHCFVSYEAPRVFCRVAVGDLISHPLRVGKKHASYHDKAADSHGRNSDQYHNSSFYIIHASCGLTFFLCHQLYSLRMSISSR